MEKFIKDYVKMILEIRGVKANRQQLQEIVNNVYDQDQLWDELDYYINSQIDKIERRIK